MPSRARRLTLAQSVLGSLPIFQMQIGRLSAWVYSTLDKATRSCVWGSHKGRRGIHLLSWDMLIRPKGLGGENIKETRNMNWSLLAKRTWRVFNSEGELWCEVLESKYNVEEHDDAHFMEKQRSTQIWKGLVLGRGAELLKRGLC